MSRKLCSNKVIKKGMNPFVYPLILVAGVWSTLKKIRVESNSRLKRELSPSYSLFLVMFSRLYYQRTRASSSICLINSRQPCGEMCRELAVQKYKNFYLQNMLKTTRHVQKNIQKQAVRHFFVKNRCFNDGCIMELLYLCRIISSSK